MDDYMPQLIRIMPDYGGEYVFDEDGGVAYSAEREQVFWRNVNT